jgi:diacylglycerol diphosphate phosphatase / phosphatidate phosphatase
MARLVDNQLIRVGFRSFPSGHSSSSFAGLFYLSLYLAGKLHVLDQRGEVWRTLVVLIPTLVASCIAISRIMDARHHPFDVLFGSAMGILVAWGSYRQYFPPVSNSWLKGRAYPIRTWGREMKAPNGSEGIAMEPLRQPANLLVEQEPQHASQGNLFRDQVSRSQRQRGSPANLDPDNPPPFARQRDQDWSEPSSDDEEEHFRVETGYREPTEDAPPEQRSSA